MAIRVMLVDDSAVVRGLVTRALTADTNIEIVASAINGTDAVREAEKQQPDIVLLDIEMPGMDGITALPKLLVVAPKCKVIMASTLTLRNADISLKALELGASDYVAKPTARTPDELENFYRELREKIYALFKTGSISPRQQVASPSKPVASKIELRNPTVPIAGGAVRALAIASSTGGPQALQQLFAGLQGKLLHIPIFVTQHMPPTFTTILADHITKTGGRPCAEGKDGEEVLPGRIYLAPGDYHMLVVEEKGKILIRLNQEPQVNFCRPAADPMFASISKVYGKNLMAVVLTGMGQDGTEGAKVIVNNNGSVIAQDEASSVVWGMPGAAAQAGVCRAILPLNDIPSYLIKEIGG